VLIDISHHQSNIDWTRATAAIDGAYVKITEGTTYVDPDWQHNHDAITAGNRPAGAYHFADLGDPTAEADHFADQYLQRSWQLRPVLDIETTGATAAWITAFRTRFRKRVPDPRFRVYSSLSLLTSALNPAGWIDADTDIWAARYAPQLGWDHPQLVLWQSSSTATIPGVLGGVDVDQYMHGWTPAADLTGADVTPDEHDALMLIRDQITGGVNPDGSLKGWKGLPLKDLTTGSLTLVDLANLTAHSLLDKRPSKVPGSTVTLSPLDAAMNADAYGFQIHAEDVDLLAAIKAVPAGAAAAVDATAVATALETAGLPGQITTSLLAALTKAATTGGTTP
jgi:GH25 family lysozyme M1 (1,4-beta-N-acetylmuramidase)